MTAAEKKRSGTLDTTAHQHIARLARLSTDPKRLVAERRLLQSTLAARLRALLTEIDEIVLPRILHLHSGPHEIARLVVANRRLIDIATSDHPTAGGDPDDLAARCAARLVEIAGLRAPLSVTISRRVSQPNRVEAACSVDALELALGLSAAESDFDRLAQRIFSLATARLWWSEGSPRVQFSGATEWAGPLQTYAARYKKISEKPVVDGRIRPTDTEGLMIPISTLQILVIAIQGKRGFVAVLPRDAGLEAIAKNNLAH